MKVAMAPRQKYEEYRLFWTLSTVYFHEHSRASFLGEMGFPSHATRDVLPAHNGSIKLLLGF
jgi:hypothetical protein